MEWHWMDGWMANVPMDGQCARAVNVLMDGWMDGQCARAANVPMDGWIDGQCARAANVPMDGQWAREACMARAANVPER